MSQLLSIKKFKEAFLSMGICLQIAEQNIVFAIDEKMAINKLKDKAGIVLLVSYPTFSRIGGQDNNNGKNAIIYWILEKNVIGQTNDAEMNQMSRLQTLSQQTLEYMDEQCSNGCTIFSLFTPEFTQMDPEYNQFGGFNGWNIEIIL